MYHGAIVGYSKATPMAQFCMYKIAFVFPICFHLSESSHPSHFSDSPIFPVAFLVPFYILWGYYLSIFYVRLSKPAHFHFNVYSYHQIDS